MSKAQENLRIQFRVTLIALLLFAVKMYAWIITHSMAILTDALESIVNIAAGFIGLYSLYVSAKPKDKDHPYGHGKVEFISAGVEGTFIILAGILIIYKAFINLQHPQTIHKLDLGILLVTATAVLNFVAGTVCMRIGKRNNSLALIASGKHLRADMVTTAGIILGLVMLYYSNIIWIDSAVAILFAVIIMVTGYKILRSSIAGIMDEADADLLEDLVTTLNQKRTENWVDLHNLRVIKYGSILHLDCHLTLPWYLNLHEAHKEIDAISGLVKEKYGDSMELFVHSDGCLDFSCAICSKQDCRERRNPFQRRIQWTKENLVSDRKHTL